MVWRHDSALLHRAAPEKPDSDSGVRWAPRLSGRAAAPRLPRMRLVLLALLVLSPADPARADATPSAWRFATRCMGTAAELTLVGTDSLALAPLAARAMASFHRVDSLMSNWTRTSEVARLNRKAGRGELTVEPETAHVLAAALRVAAESGGAFDITVEPLVRLWGFLGGTPHRPPAADIAALLERVGYERIEFDAATRTLSFDRPDLRVDLGGIAKGYAVDCVADSLAALGVENALVNLSGNIALLGAPPGRPSWRLGLRDPEGEVASLGTLLPPRAAVATSGDYEQFVVDDGRRFGHILDPRTGWPVRELASVTVIADRAVDADAWATALCVLGPEAARRLARAREDLAVILVERAESGPHTLWVEAPLADAFRLDPSLSDRFRLRTF